MAHAAVRRTVRSLGIATVAALPLCFVACATPEEASEPLTLNNELRAASGSDLLDLPSERSYEVTSLTLVEPDLSAFGLSVVPGSGSMVLRDGVITEATLLVSIADRAELSFVLTEPVVLRRDGSSGEMLIATGTLTLNDTERYTTRAFITPDFEDDDTAEFDVVLDLPDHPLGPTASSGSFPEDLESVEMTVSLAARDAAGQEVE